MQAMLSTRHSSNGRGYDIHNVYSAFRKVMMRVRIPVFHLIFYHLCCFFVISLFVCLFLFWLFLMLLFYTSVFVVFFFQICQCSFFSSSYFIYFSYTFKIHLSVFCIFIQISVSMNRWTIQTVMTEWFLFKRV